MQTVSPEFTALADGKFRPVTFSVRISFRKEYDPSIDFVTIGVSTIGGSDMIRGVGNVIQESDKYVYEDYSDRVLSVEYENETNPPTNSLTLGIADIVLDNHDDLFTPNNTASPLYGYLVSKRPIKIAIGFGGENVQVFVGLTQTRPQIDERAKTVKFSCLDFLSAVLAQPVAEDVMYIDMRTDEIISQVLQGAGITTAQMDLDVGSVIIPFAFSAKDSTRGDIISQVAQAELGNVSLSGPGIIRFQNRTSWNTNTPVWELSKLNTHERKENSESGVVNTVKVYSKARAIASLQKIWSPDSPIEIPANGTHVEFPDFTDEYGALPVTSMVDPEYYTTATTSRFITNTLSDGTGDAMDGSITLTSSDLFSTSAKLEFTNTSDVPIFLTKLEIYGTPARVVNNIYEPVTDPASVGDRDGFEEEILEIRNDLIQDATAARTIGQLIIEDRAQEDNQISVLAKGLPHLEISDVLSWTEPDQEGDYFTTRIGGILNSSGFRQQLKLSKRTINIYFRVGMSTIGGPDKIGP